MFIDNLIEKIKEKQNHSIVGLDPRISMVPDYIVKKHRTKYDNFRIAEANAILEFNKIVIDSVFEIVACIKPQIAFYEKYGIEGMKVFKKTIEYAKQKGLMVLADIKRGDIGSTAKAYSDAYLGGEFVDVDAVTINPYLGEDSVAPFLEYCDEKGVFVLAKTSNKSSKDLQDISIDGKKLYQITGQYIKKWGSNYIGKYGYSSIGAVVGATFPKELELLRNENENVYFLVPGYGAQGGKAEDIVSCFNKDGLGAIVNSSRGIIAAHQKAENINKYREKEFMYAIKDAALKMKVDINNELEKQNKIAW